MRVRKTGIPEVSASGRISARRPDSSREGADAATRSAESTHTARLPVPQKRSSDRPNAVAAGPRNSAQFLTQVIAQSDGTHSEARLARRFPQRALSGYASAASLKHVETVTGARLHLDGV